ncbi:MAG: hypothetical protein ACSHWU_11410 [Marinicella sp.]
MKNKWLLIVLILIDMSSVHAKRLGLTFDREGKMISPDDYLVHQALIDDEDGYFNDAMWRLKEAAEYGNKHGQYYAGLLYLQKDDYVNGYAWLKLAGDGFMNNPNLLPAVLATLEKRNLKQQADQELNQLKEQINFESSVAKRLQWFKRLKFAGTHIGGYIPILWRTELWDGLQAKGYELRRDINDYIFNYRYQRGDVRLKELELQEKI